ncbi:helix-turn-helix domain-containing protein [Saccharomonospora glauca]|uniref:Response regulator containing a CheY-like receiver domain and an HTH DNA-binding domain n=1 Tax=Saccharomonospora glauca K62 TaxID=928724 RepID=I1D6K4_9PSEU|nr:helix-turn-helix domain-containing protein [Saccharomonospora glauca]EIF00579.1 response regulator containing a CheY-like receiver domain and an HTH DNA-binding domain [Saccharomonospora glauca K62]
MLECLGLDERAEQAYRLLLDRPESEASLVGEHLGLSPDAVAATLEKLHTLGLVEHLPGDRVRPVHPAIAFPPLLASARRELRAEEQRLDLAAAAVEELTVHAGRSPATASPETRVNHGTAAALQCLEHITATATRSVDALAAAGPAPGITDPTDYTPIIEFAIRLAERGVRLRVIMLDSINYLTPLVEGAHRMRAAGVEIKTAPALPVWTLVVDGEYVVSALAPDDHTRGSLLVRTPGAVAAAADLFEKYWLTATPLDGVDSPGHDETPLTRAQKQLLIMVANGNKDETVARRFSVSTRTVRRMIAELYDLAGVSSRIQLVFRAAQLGWLDGSELDRV